MSDDNSVSREAADLVHIMIEAMTEFEDADRRARFEVARTHSLGAVLSVADEEQEELRAEIEDLRKALSALTEAHRRLVEKAGKE